VATGEGSVSGNSFIGVTKALGDELSLVGPDKVSLLIGDDSNTCGGVFGGE
jgi:hypothetical protein